jgi:hypothetical protein
MKNKLSDILGMLALFGIWATIIYFLFWGGK